MTPAARLTAEIRLACSKVGARLFVVTVGKFWAGRPVRKFEKTERVTINVLKGDLLLRAARIVNIGTVGQSDLGGWTPVVVTQEMVGQTVAIHTVVEVKTENDRPTSEQLAYIDAVNKSGGRAGIARSPGDAVRIVRGEA